MPDRSRGLFLAYPLRIGAWEGLMELRGRFVGLRERRQISHIAIPVGADKASVGARRIRAIQSRAVCGPQGAKAAGIGDSRESRTGRATMIDPAPLPTGAQRFQRRSGRPALTSRRFCRLVPRPPFSLLTRTPGPLVAGSGGSGICGKGGGIPSPLLGSRTARRDRARIFQRILRGVGVLSFPIAEGLGRSRSPASTARDLGPCKPATNCPAR